MHVHLRLELSAWGRSKRHEDQRYIRPSLHAHPPPPSPTHQSALNGQCFMSACTGPSWNFRPMSLGTNFLSPFIANTSITQLHEDTQLLRVETWVVPSHSLRLLRYPQPSPHELILHIQLIPRTRAHNIRNLDPPQPSRDKAMSCTTIPPSPRPPPTTSAKHPLGIVDPGSTGLSRGRLGLGLTFVSAGLCMQFNF